MERQVRALVLVCTLMIPGMVATSPTRANDDNENACGAVLCLAGLIQGGNGGRECSQYEAKYFSIVR
ncbi:hypothetical protein [Paraburkholderia franconis]|uniref:hypothetical protein n=1 Tax=Paraburkholderia franconis TaxID=2654983 RepID=UPI001D117287|nr:hypothetical protein [Paraburkholderia franconis]